MAKVLIVEDDNNLREIFEMRLQADGYKTLAAGDGEEGLVVAMREKPDLIIADVMMPKMSGFEMLETLRSAPETANTKVVMMTALGQAEDQARGAKLGVVKYLVKSQVTLEDFARVVGEVLGPAKSATDSPSGQGTNSTEASSSNNNKVESEKSMDNTTPTNPTAPADGATGGNPISGPAPGDMGGGQQTTADEQSTVQSQVNDFASGTPAGDSSTPATGGDSSGMPSTDPAAGGTTNADVPVAPPPADPAGGSSDPTAPAAPSDGSGGAPA